MFTLIKILIFLVILAVLVFAGMIIYLKSGKTTNEGVSKIRKVLRFFGIK